MDTNDLRALMTLVAFLAFLGIVVWAYSGRRQAAFDEAARLPFTDDEDNDQAGAAAAAPRHR